MSIKSKIRNWLGITEIYTVVNEIATHQYNHRLIIDATLREVRVATLGLGRVIAKLDPNFTKDPHSKETLQASDKIGEAVIKRLKGEFEASNPTGPK